ncbi:MAG: hypothetical protein Q9M24_00235 [Mariprofundaceae bacterium]|nr:hypothetical protein [Mariprofundaceae bacterium]
MNKIRKSMVAGFVATIVLSVLMVMKMKMGVMPDLNAIKMMTTMAHGMLGTPAVPVVGWMMHFMIGTVLWGVLFAVIGKLLPGSGYVSKGLSFGVLAWVLMMVMVMPMAGAGFFGLSLGMMAPVMTLMLHLVYGAVLGGLYGKLLSSASDAGT